MTIRSARLPATATSANLATGPATLYNLHWSTATGSVGTIDLRDGLTPTATTSLLVIDTPHGGGNSGAAGDLDVAGGGLKFHVGISAVKTNTGGLTIIYRDGV